MIVHFPIALLTIGFFSEVSALFFHDGKYLSKTGFYLLVTGAVEAILAWSTGQLFTTEPTQGATLEIFNKHETGALITMILAVAAAAFRLYLVVVKREETSLRWIALGVYCLAFLAVTFTGFMGGAMVYNYMMAL